MIAPSQISPGRLFETLFMDRVLEQPALHIRTARWPTDLPRDALTALVDPDRVVECDRE